LINNIYVLNIKIYLKEKIFKSVLFSYEMVVYTISTNGQGIKFSDRVLLRSSRVMQPNIPAIKRADPPAGGGG
jgi:hypothetical protein